MNARASIAVALFTAAAILATAAAGFAPFKDWAERQWAADLGRQLAAAADADVPQYIAALEARPLAGTREIVAAMASPRAAVADAASRSLARSLDDWRLAPGDAASRRIAVAAKELARVAPHLDVRKQQAARGLARHWLAWPLDPVAVDSAAVITDCEAIVRACPAARLPVIVPDSELQTEASAVEIAVPEGQNLELPHVESRQPVLVGRRNTTEPATQPQVAAPLAEPARFEPPPIEPVEPKRFLPPRAEQLPPTALPPPVEQKPPPELQPPIVRGTPEVRQAAAFEPFHVLGDVEVMAQLHAPDGAVAAAAAAELMRRGYRGPHLAVARAASHPDPRQRLALVESLPQTAGIDPGPWLAHLARDTDAAVRTAASAILAASNGWPRNEQLR